MKKIIPAIAVVVLFSGFARGEGVYLKIFGSYFSPTEEAFGDIYGGGIKYGAELAFKVWNRLDIWVDGSFLSRTGELTFTKEETKLRIIPLGAGLRYRLSSGALNPYISGGICYFLFHEENVIGTVDKGGVGFKGKIGAFWAFTRKMMLDIFVEYSYGKMTPADFKINLGGIEAGIGFGFQL